MNDDETGNSYPKETCLFPPLKSALIDKCKDECISTVTVIPDMSSDMWGRKILIDMLSKKHRVLTFNNRGHYNVEYGDKITREGDDGTTRNITKYMPDPFICKNEYGIDAYTIDMFVDDTKRMMEKHGIKKTDITGFSLGGTIAQAFAAKYPEKTRRVAIGKSFSRFQEYVNIVKHIGMGTPFKIGYWIWCNSRPKINSERPYGCNVPLSIANEIGKSILNIDTRKYQVDITAPTLSINCSDDQIFGFPVNNIENIKKIDMKMCGHVFNARNEEMYEKIVDFFNKK